MNWITTALSETAPKQCACCKEWKPLDEFHRNRTEKDGHHRRCKACKNTAGRKHYATPLPRKRNREMAKVYQARYWAKKRAHEGGE